MDNESDRLVGGAAVTRTVTQQLSREFFGRGEAVVVEEMALLGHDIEAAPWVGRYWIVERLGAGNMGTVYRAYDYHLNRRVALKVLRVGAEHSPEAERDALQKEARSLAQVSHRNVVAVHDVGITSSGCLYIAMEFVEGQDLKAHCRNKSWPEVLTVYADAAAGLAACHRAGLVHRDFKPSNVIVENTGRAVILDFGVADGATGIPVTHMFRDSDPAKSPNKPPLTESDSAPAIAVCGTPGYMSPEQLSGQKVRAASDQFSFCAALYESLYGVKPFGRADNVLAMARKVLQGRIEPPPPRTRVPRWVYKALSRGLRVDPQERWPSMDALRGVLQRQSQKRHRPTALLAAVVLGAILVGIGVSVPIRVREACRADEVAAWNQIWDAPRRRQVTKAFARLGLGYAPETWRQAQQNVERFLSEWKTTQQAVCLQAQRDGTRGSPAYEAVEYCLRNQMKLLASLVEVWSDPDATVVDHAAAAAADLPHPAQCSAMRNRLTPKPWVPQQQRSTKIHPVLSDAQALLLAGKYDAALELATKAVEETGAPELKHRAVRANLYAGVAMARLGAYEDASHTLERVFLDAGACGDDAHTLTAGGLLVSIYGNALRRYAEGERWYRLCKMLQERLALTNSNQLVAAFESHYAEIQSRQGLHSDALGRFQRILRDHETVYGKDHLHVASALSSLATAHSRQGEYQTSLTHFERALSIRKLSLGAGHPDVARTLRRVADMEKHLGEYARACRHYEQAFGRLEARFGGGNPEVAMMQYNVGDCQRLAGNPAQGLRSLLKAQAHLEARLGPRHLWVAYPLMAIGQARNAIGRPRQALPPLLRALSIRRTQSDDPALLGDTLFAVARVYDRSKKRRKLALALAKEARSMYKTATSATAPKLDAIQTWIAERDTGVTFASPSPL